VAQYSVVRSELQWMALVLLLPLFDGVGVEFTSWLLCLWLSSLALDLCKSNEVSLDLTSCASSLTNFGYIYLLIFTGLYLE
jgi:hypothetical protein